MNIKFGYRGDGIERIDLAQYDGFEVKEQFGEREDALSSRL